MSRIEALRLLNAEIETDLESRPKAITRRVIHEAIKELETPDFVTLFDNGDYARLGFILSGEYKFNGCECENCLKTSDMLRRLRGIIKEDHQR